MQKDNYTAMANAIASVWKSKPRGDTTISSKDVHTLLQERGENVSEEEVSTGLDYLAYSGCFSIAPAEGEDSGKTISDVNLERLRRWTGG